MDKSQWKFLRIGEMLPFIDFFTGLGLLLWYFCHPSSITTCCCCCMLGLKTALLEDLPPFFQHSFSTHHMDYRSLQLFHIQPPIHGSLCMLLRTRSSTYVLGGYYNSSQECFGLKVFSDFGLLQNEFIIMVLPPRRRLVSGQSSPKAIQCQKKKIRNQKQMQRVLLERNSYSACMHPASYKQLSSYPCSHKPTQDVLASNVSR